MLQGKKIVLGVSGSVAAYKAVYLTRLLTDANATVWPVLTAGASRFVGPLSFTVLSRNRCVTDLWNASGGGEISHVELAHTADAVVIAPATADLLARLAAGRADDPLCALALATRAPRLLAPAMETHMWEHPATQAHLHALEARGWRVAAPAPGALASGRQGTGRLADPEELLEAVTGLLRPQDLLGETVLVTAGPTQERLDPARFLSNPSTGKMGYAIAREARRRGAHVELISGPTALPAPPGVVLTRILSTDELLAACLAKLGPASALVMAAAPADFRPAAPLAHKQKKEGAPLTLALERTPDVLTTLKARQGRRVVVGFAAETEDLLAHGEDKLRRKDCDLLVANRI
ncbi:MAG TPA: bifunctional phosphopantothenoylcysteine decarboxylase/phosphopantothenate--cysteine ligase CoaBC, partial [Myxococcota bacterium]|nr:bifunctional phosphopantothenoylcysteine decarboxylase/phosphopantothenate--cysteine ligase CoaBC [Myxococcota bacterium]